MRQAVVILLLLVFAILAVSSMRENSGTCDEIAHHIPAGYSYYKKFDFRLNPSNPPLARYIMALPLVFVDLKAPFGDQSWLEADTPVFGKKFIHEDNREQARLILFLGRLAMVCVGLFTGLLVYRIASVYYGSDAGLLALFIYCFSPEILAHSTLATTDITAACFIILALYCFRKFMDSPGEKNLFLAAFTLGLAELSKYSALLLYPVYLLLWLIGSLTARRFNFKLLNNILMIFIVSLLTIWAGYGFRVKPFLSEANRPEEKVAFVKNLGARLLPFWNQGLSQKSEDFLRKTPLPLTTYITGIFGVARHSRQGHLNFFLGNWSTQGHSLHYVVASLIKMPLSFLILLLLAFLSFFYRPPARNDIYLLLPAAAMFISASLSNLQVGLRYILPVYVLGIIFSSRIAAYVNNNRRRIGIAILGAWLVIANILAWPHYLSYFNELIGGGDNGWKYLRDSNIDWGQDLPSLARYLKKNHIPEITIEYFGQDDPALYGINYSKFKEKEFKSPEKKVYAISAHYLEHASWAAHTPPSAKAGWSIFIYDLRDERYIQK